MDETALGRFGDKRRADLGAVLLSAVQSKRTLCIHRLAEDRNQTLRFNNFLANPAVSTHEMLVTAGQKTNRRAAGRHVLGIMDTTDVLFPTQKANKRGFGLGSDGTHPGLFLHPVLAVDAVNGGIIGLVDCIVLNRTEGRVSQAKTSTTKKVKTHKKRTADDKESRRWLQATEMAGDALTDADMITMVGDREGDIYHLFAHRPANVHLLVRSAQPRTLATGGLLPDHCAALPEQARETIDVPAKGKQPARKATVWRFGRGFSRTARNAEVAMRFALALPFHPASPDGTLGKFRPISLKRPAMSPDKGQPEMVPLWVVDVQEIDPPEGVERLSWRLLTTHTVTTLEQARQIVAWYRMRWIIEQVFRSMKSDCLRIEDSQIEDANRFTKLAIIGLIAAIRSMQLVMARDGSTGQPVADAADPADMPALRALNASLEGRTQKLKNPYDEKLLAWYAWIVARLGGWSGRSSRGYRPPGPKTMHHGLLRLDPTLTGWRLANRSADVRLH
jgi:Transposase DDE domain